VIIAHLTDLHVSKYGARMTMLRGKTAKGRLWEPFWEEAGWRIEIRGAEGLRIRDAFRLVDNEDRVHRVAKVQTGSNRKVVLDTLRQLRDLRLQTSCENLAQRIPSSRQLMQFLRQDPDNGNLRFCLMAQALQRDNPDWVVITGDLTDDGVGYGLLKTGLARFIETRRLICIPGNHDIYPTPPVWNDKELRQTEKRKRQLWSAFAAEIGLNPDESGVHELAKNVLLARLDSCHPSRVPGSASGYVPPQQLEKISDQLRNYSPRALRLACLHHPVGQLPYKKIGLSLYQPGMRLRNGQSIFTHLKDFGFSVAMTGHRHVGYHYQPLAGPVSLSAPSTTYGCRTGVKPFYWCLEIFQEAIRSIQPVSIQALAHI
jgi:3',5'-cyclic AMP phosphodiesterase CpdA